MNKADIFKSYSDRFFSFLTPREKRAFWLMTGINTFFLFVMSIFTPVSILLAIAFWTVVQASIIIYYVLVNKLQRKSKSREWVEAIAFAVVAATLIRTFFIEAYTIPTSSMEKSLLVGDFLFVSKINYGARAPMTPVSFPFAHNTMPVVGGNSYTSLFSMPYLRLPGFQKIKNNDVVVFNYPFEDGRPVDKKENYIKRCLAIAGDTILVRNQQVFINGVAAENPPKMQHKYFVKTDGGGFSQRVLKDLEITEGNSLSPNGDFEITMTEEARLKIKNMQHVKQCDSVVQTQDVFVEYIFPFRKELPWNVDNFGPLYVPKAGDVITLDTINFWMYDRVIRTYELNQSFEMRDGKFYLNGNPITQYTFKQDYYFMMGDNRHNSADSRFWGFVPHDHIVGKALFIWLSLDPNESNILNKVRWKRMFNGIN
jgi:signal peptidase I